MADQDYQNIEIPYNNLLERNPADFGLLSMSPTNESGTAPVPTSVQDPSDIDPGSVVGQSFDNLFIGSWIKSRNWQPQVRGFYIDGRTGYAEFTNILITGSITATTGTIGGFVIGTNYIRDSANMFGLSSVVTGGDDVRFWAGASFDNRATAPFRVTESGVMTATTGTFSGTLSAPSGTIGGFTIGASDLSATATGNTTIVSSGATAFAAGPTGSPTFTVTQAGALTVTGGSITGGTIRTSAGTTRVEMDSGSNTLIAYVSGDVRALFGGTSGAISVSPISGVGGGMISTVANQLTFFAGENPAIEGSIRLEAYSGVTMYSVGSTNGLTIDRDTGVGRGIYIDYVANEPGTVVGLGMALSNLDSGDIFAFEFDGDEIQSGAVGGSQDQKISIRIGSTQYYIPCYTS